MKSLLVAAVLALLPLAALADDPASITFSGTTIYPESVTWSATQQVFFLGSVAHGTIGKLDMAGNYKAFATPQGLPSTFGIRVDDAHGKLWVAGGDLGAGEATSPATQGKLAEVVALDSTTGQEVGRYDLASQGSGPHLANDIAVDGQGNAYVTDSFAHVVYRIDPQGQLAEFARSPLFETGEGYGLNGIVVHPDGFLLVGAFNSGEIFRIDLKDPTKVTRVEAPKVAGMDGFALKSPTQIVGALSGFGAPAGAVEITSTDGWKTAQITATKPALASFPASVTVEGDTAWVLNTRLDTLLDPAAAKVNDFVLQNFEQTQK